MIVQDGYMPKKTTTQKYMFKQLYILKKWRSLSNSEWSFQEYIMTTDGRLNQ